MDGNCPSLCLVLLLVMLTVSDGDESCYHADDHLEWIFCYCLSRVVVENLLFHLEPSKGVCPLHDKI